MNPSTRHALGLMPLPDEQARRIQAQADDLRAGKYARWPAGLPETIWSAPYTDDDRQPSGFAFDITPQP